MRLTVLALGALCLATSATAQTPEQTAEADREVRSALKVIDGTISDIRQLALVITQGQAIYPMDIYQSMGIKPFVTAKPVIKQSAATPGKGAGGAKHGHRH